MALNRLRRSQRRRPCRLLDVLGGLVPNTRMGRSRPSGREDLPMLKVILGGTVEPIKVGISIDIETVFKNCKLKILFLVSNLCGFMMTMFTIYIRRVGKIRVNFAHLPLKT